ncbi:hypothetical protein Nepgr_011149 [Nepenthes gracilis]|uniref:Uncharacterized protein n=1 Tax=Nepenthes gracilis TaxID=150966 RepID=A0AAD3SDR4_NEPGR|nr:hypothetical protein Nepgr_011149 [Nepenthes gracilis]
MRDRAVHVGDDHAGEDHVGVDLGAKVLLRIEALESFLVQLSERWSTEMVVRETFEMELQLGIYEREILECFNRRGKISKRKNPGEEKSWSALNGKSRGALEKKSRRALTRRP